MHRTGSVIVGERSPEHAGDPNFDLLTHSARENHKAL